MAQATIGALRVVLGADTAAFSKDLGSAQKRLFGFSIDAKKAGALIGTAIAGAAIGISVAVKRTIDDADMLSKTSKKIGVPVEELSRLRYAADLSGVSFETLTKGIQRFSRNIFEGAQGLQTPIRAFQVLGIEIKNADGRLKTVGEAIPEIAERFSKMRDGTEKTALAMQLFGRAGAELIPLLNEGADGVRSLMNEADELGIVIDSKAAAAAEQFNDNLTRLSKVGEAFTVSIVNRMTPGLVTVTEKMLAAKLQLNEWGNEFRRFLGLIDETEEKFGALSFGDFAMPGAIAPGDAPDVENEVEKRKQLADAQRAVNEAEREHQAILSEGESVRRMSLTAAQAFDEELQNNQRLLKAGAIDLQTFNAANQRVAEQYGATWQQTALSVSGSMANISGAFADENSSMAKVARVIGIAQATIAMFVGAAEALKLPFPANLGAMAAVLGQGASLVASIKSQKVPSFAHGGQFTVGGTPGMDNNLVAMNLSRGERVTVDPPGHESQMMSRRRIDVPTVSPRDFVRGDIFNALVDSLIDFQKDGGKLVLGRA